ncbi:MAG: GNAT family N-acetyltransferase [Cyanobacteria bacterium RUI128]|nr:GNAT family N-acetyltransferase [Cyanobacteria bacterium RUI128]
MSENLTLINQVYLILAPKGVSRDAVAKLDDTTLQEILGKITANEGIEDILGYVLEKAPDLADPETLQKNREIREENGDTIIDEKNGDVLAQRTIIHKDGDNIIETVIVYTDGKPSSKTIKKNGNTQETSTYEEVTTSEYLTEEEALAGKTIVKISTDKSRSDGSKVTTYVTNVGENGEYTDNELLEEETRALSGETRRIRLTPDGNISEFTNTAAGRETIVYKGTDFAAYRNGEAEVISDLDIIRDTPLTAEQMEHFAAGSVGENDSPFQEIIKAISQIDSGNNEAGYDRVKIRQLFANLDDPNSGYVKINDNPPTYGKPVTDAEGNVTYEQKITVNPKHDRMQYKGSYRAFAEDAEYYIANETPGQEGTYYRFTKDGTFKCITETDLKTPNIQIHRYPNGETEKVEYDENGELSLSQFYNSKHQLTSIASFETDEQGQIYEAVIYTEFENNPELQNKLVQYYPTGNMLIYKKNDDGTYSLEKERLVNTVPIHNNLLDDNVGTCPITYLDLNADGIVTGEGLYTRQDLYKLIDVSRGESIDFSEFDKNTRETTADMIISTLESVIEKYESKKEDQSWLDASYWFRKIAGETVEEKIETLKEYLTKAKQLKGLTGNPKSFNEVFQEIGQCNFEDCQERFIRYNQKIEALNNNLQTIYINYKQNGKLSDEEKGVFARYCGQNFWDGVVAAHFNNFIIEADNNLKDSSNECPMLATNVANSYIYSLSSDPLSRTQVGRTVTNFESTEQFLDMYGGVLDLASMVLEFGAISKGLNYMFKGGKWLVRAGAPSKITKALDTANEFMQAEGRLSKSARFMTQLTARAGVGGANFATYDMLHELGRQGANGEELNWDKIREKGWLGFKTGAAASFLSTFTSEPLAKWIRGKGNANVVSSVQNELLNGGEVIKGSQLGNAIRSAQAMPEYDAAREMLAKGAGFATEVISFTAASSTINMLDRSNLKETLLKTKKYTEADIEQMSTADIMRAMLELQGTDIKNMSDAEIYWAYTKSEYCNQFVGLAQIKLTESVLGMFLSKGKMPKIGTEPGPRERSTEFVRNEHGNYYYKNDPTKTELSHEQVTAIMEQAMAFDAIESRLNNRFNNYGTLTGNEFINIIHGREPNEPVTERELNAGDEIKIEIKGGEYKVTAKDGHTEVFDCIEDVMNFYTEAVIMENLTTQAFPLEHTEHTVISEPELELDMTDTDVTGIDADAASTVSERPVGHVQNVKTGRFEYLQISVEGTPGKNNEFKIRATDGNGRTIGLVKIDNTSEYTVEPGCYVEFIATSPNYRGVGSELMREVVKYSNEFGLDGKVWLKAVTNDLPNEFLAICGGGRAHTSAAVAYKRMGFEAFDGEVDTRISDEISSGGTGIQGDIDLFRGSLMRLPQTAIDKYMSKNRELAEQLDSSHANVLEELNKSGMRYKRYKLEDEDGEIAQCIFLYDKMGNVSGLVGCDENGEFTMFENNLTPEEYANIEKKFKTEWNILEVTESIQTTSTDTTTAERLETEFLTKCKQEFINIPTISEVNGRRPANTIRNNETGQLEPVFIEKDYHVRGDSAHTFMDDGTFRLIAVNTDKKIIGTVNVCTNDNGTIEIRYMGTSPDYTGIGTELLRQAVIYSYETGHNGKVEIPRCSLGEVQQNGMQIAHKKLFNESPAIIFTRMGFVATDENIARRINEAIETGDNGVDSSNKGYHDKFENTRLTLPDEKIAEYLGISIEELRANQTSFLETVDTEIDADGTYTSADIARMRGEGRNITTQNDIVYEFNPATKENKQIGQLSVDSPTGTETQETSIAPLHDAREFKNPIMKGFFINQKQGMMRTRMLDLDAAICNLPEGEIKNYVDKKLSQIKTFQDVVEIETLVDAYNEINGNYSHYQDLYSTQNGEMAVKSNVSKMNVFLKDKRQNLQFVRTIKKNSDEVLTADKRFKIFRGDFAESTRFDSLKKYIKTYPQSEMSELLYKRYLNAKTRNNSDLANELMNINEKYGVKIFLPSSYNYNRTIETLSYVHEELNKWQIASNGAAKMPPIIDFSTAKVDWYDTSSAYGQGAANACSERATGSLGFHDMDKQTVQKSLRHELTHSNDLTRTGWKIPEKYDLNEIMPKKTIVLNGKTIQVPDFENCKYVDEFRRAGLPEELIAYGYNSPAELIARASEGNLKSYSPEFRQVLIDFGMPEWLFDLDG